MLKDSIYWIWLAQRLGAGSRYIPYLMERYSDSFEVFRADPEELKDAELPEAVQAALSDKNLEEAQAIMDYCARLRIGICTYQSENYPAGLKKLKRPPAVLYYRGRMPDLTSRLSLSIVGTRKMSEYGKRAGYKIAYELASAGVIVVSGMALGVDSVAACGALAAGGQTVAVLGCGVDVIYPKEHATLYSKIIENGAVISEYPPTSRPEPRHFPERNRIISGISYGTLVVEADLKSGALITADHALEQGKDLFALPGNIGSPNTDGTNKLLRDGADLVTETDDILERYALYHGSKINYVALNNAKDRSDVSDAVLAKYGIHLRSAGEERLHELSNTVVSPRHSKAPRPRVPSKVSDDRESLTSIQIESISMPEAGQEMKAQQTEAPSDMPARFKEIFGLLPDGRAVTFEDISASCKNSGEAMSALTYFEVKGLVDTLPGGLYIKR